MTTQDTKIFLHKNDLPQNLNLGDCIAIDTETLGLNPIRDRLCLMQISSGNGEAHLIQFDGDNYEAPVLCQLLSNIEIAKIFHFARFDLAVIKHYLQISCGPVFCTKIASLLTRTYTDKHGLKNLVQEILDIDISKRQQSSDWGSENLSESQKEYAASDVLYLHKLQENLEKRLEREKRMGLAESCFSFLPERSKLDIEGWKDEDIFSH